jgi:hypothetical protein
MQLFVMHTVLLCNVSMQCLLQYTALPRVWHNARQCTAMCDAEVHCNHEAILLCAVVLQSIVALTVVLQ